MDTKLILLTGLALLGIFCAVNGQRCCTPDQWQGVQGSVSGYVYRRKPGRVEGVVHVFYDYTNKQSAAFANYTSSSTKPRSYRIVTRYSDKNCAACVGGKLYVVDLQNDKCYTKKIDRPFRRACIPDEAKEEGTFDFGAGDATLKGRGYRMEVRSEKYQLDFQVTVTDQGCIPVGEVLTGVARGVPLMETVGFVNIKPGIKDPAVFDVPEECEELSGLSDGTWDCSWVHHRETGPGVQYLCLLSGHILVTVFCLQTLHHILPSFYIVTYCFPIFSSAFENAKISIKNKKIESHKCTEKVLLVSCLK